MISSKLVQQSLNRAVTFFFFYRDFTVQVSYHSGLPPLFCRRMDWSTFGFAGADGRNAPTLFNSTAG